ncbi:arginine--tRNA ligase [Litchfieldia alkalitelluris]|uniref:arginine--tRNA ligase n=1 Tax=Litchfieldia alkalitelluris TaxID=304268 RepID=UPI0009968A6A|nr:arginine--tRNA ligase [Litchfieldia alkalitelluris]
MNYKNSFAKLLENNLDGALSLDEVLPLIEKPRYQQQGDYAFPCFILAKKFKKSPQVIASEIAENLTHPLFEQIVSDGPYINCFLNKSTFSIETLNLILTQKANYGDSSLGNDENIVIDFSSPNIAKPFSMGHLRSTVIGYALANIATKCGFNTIRINHLGDWGTQFGKLIVAYKQWGDENVVKQNPIQELLKLYVKFHDVALLQPELDDEARLWFKKLEDGDQEAASLWTWFKNESLKEFAKIYKLLGISFDSYHGEAFYNDKIKDTVQLIKEKNLLSTSDGAEVVDLSDHDLPPCLIRKSDGATLYATRDISAALYRQENYQFQKALYVVGQEQSLHFKQLFLVLKKMGYTWADDMNHIPFGFILKDGKKMSTRKGKVVLLEDVIREAIELAAKNIHEKNPTLNNQEEIAKLVGVGSLIFHDLKNERMSNIEFSIEDMLKFEGTTGPYVQYTHARACSILRKGRAYSTALNDGLDDPQSWAVIKRLSEFPEVIESSFYSYEPSVIAKYVLDLAQEFNSYYGTVKILADTKERPARLALVQSVAIVLGEGLRLLGLGAPKEM